MSQVRSLLLAILAVLALASPSLAIGVTATTAGAAAVAVADDGEQPGYRPCELQGGKRMLPCPPDLGLPLRSTMQGQWRSASLLRPVPQAWLAERAPKTDPPPPRRV